VAGTPQSGATDPSGQPASRSGVGRLTGLRSHRIGTSSSVKAAGRFLRRQVWAWPIIAAIILGAVGWAVHRSVEDAMREQRATELNVIADASVNAIRTWTGEQLSNVELFAADEPTQRLVAELIPFADGTPAAERKLVQAPAQDALRARLKRRLELSGYVGFFVVAPDGVVLAADQDPPVGKRLADYRKEFFNRANAGDAVVSRPYRSPLLLADHTGTVRANLPTMFVAGPLRDNTGRSIAALGLRVRPEDRFTRMLEVVRYGQSGETYAFDAHGLLMSQSRFDDNLKQIGLLTDQPDSQSILTVEIRDPGVNMAAGERPGVRRSDQPLTSAAAEAVQGRDGVDADGYRGYRGVPKVGAWRWLPEYELGIVTEVDRDEAFRPVYLLRRAFWSLMGLLALSAVGIFVVMLVLARQQRALQKATLAARQLGQYTLEKKLGAGGMGTVYRARHAMLRRPTAVKLLNLDTMTEGTVARFEREVQLTSTLTHPNTVAVFDYGRTPDGLFYYAMEYLDGTNLEELVARVGPLPEARVVFLLRQVCGALAEAHAAGMVHRDVKPANIFLTRRGGLYDFVKLLDFGLAKPLASEESAGITAANAIVGTPHYLSPEAVNQPDALDARADVYAVGAVGYFLLTGTTVFSGATALDVCLKHAREEPVPPSRRSANNPVSPGLEALVMRCLAKAPTERPRDADELLCELEACRVSGTWMASDAAAWWANRKDLGPTPGAGGSAPTSSGQGKETSSPAVTIEYQNE
jgi:eukaryotic-like serine/threonine-protein kinase